MLPSSKNLITSFICFTLLICSSSQYAIDRPFRLYKSSSFVQRSPSLGLSGRTRVTSFSEYSKTSNSQIREKDIAAIFRGVAYGATESSESSSASLSSPSPLQTTVRTAVESKFSSTTSTSTSLSSAEPSINKGLQETLETLEVIPALPSESSPSHSNPSLENQEASRNGILNYYVEDNRNNGREHIHRDFYPEVISSVNPDTIDSSATNSYVVSGNSVQKSIAIHVYLIGFFMGCIILCSLCCLCRIHSCSQLIPRGHYVTLQLLILLAAALRCITLFHDPYGLDGKLPRALMSLLINSVAPLLSTVFALMLLVLLRAAKLLLLPPWIQSPLMLALVCGLHIGGSVLVDVANGVLDYPESSARAEIIMQSMTVSWNFVLIIGYAIVLYQGFVRASKRRAVFPISTCATMSLAVVLQALLAGFMIFHISVKAFGNEDLNSSSSRSVSWWVLISFERMAEILFCFSLLVAAGTLTMKQSNLNNKEQKIFSVISGYDQNTYRTGSPNHKNFKATNYALAYSLQNKGHVNINMSPKTIVSANTKICDSTADFAVQWNTNRNQPDICPRNVESDTSTMHPGHFPSMQRTSSNYHSKTLPHQPRYYCAPVPQIASNSPVHCRIEPYTLRPQKQNHIYSEIEEPAYDVAVSCYQKSEATDCNGVYYSPQPTHPSFVRAQSTDHLYELPGLHQPSVSQPDANSMSYRTQYTSQASYASENHHSLALPLSQSQAPSRNYHQRVPQLDTSPDSAIVLDYSSHSELEEQYRNCNQERKISNVSKLDFMNLSTHSLNELFKHNSGLLSKLVGNSNSNAKYQPLNVEENNGGSADHQLLVDDESRIDSTPSTVPSTNQQVDVNNYPPVSTPLISCPSPVTSL